MPPLEAAAIMLPIMIVQDAIAVWVYRKDWNGAHPRHHDPRRGDRRRRRVAGSPPISPTPRCASSSASPRSSSSRYTLDRRRRGRRAQRPASRACRRGVFWGALSGFTSTICQAGGPPYQMYVLPQQLPKMTFVGTTAIFFAAMNCAEGRALSTRSASSRRRASRTSLALLPLGARHQPARLLAGAPHAAGAVLPHHA